MALRTSPGRFNNEGAFGSIGCDTGGGTLSVAVAASVSFCVFAILVTAMSLDSTSLTVAGVAPPAVVPGVALMSLAVTLRGWSQSP